MLSTPAACGSKRKPPRPERSPNTIRCSPSCLSTAASMPLLISLPARALLCHRKEIHESQNTLCVVGRRGSGGGGRLVCCEAFQGGEKTGGFRWTQDSLLPKCDAPLDQVRQAGALHDLRHATVPG